ncbi:hypothetical protein OROMI_018236 [Orobanche minor]
MMEYSATKLLTALNKYPNPLICGGSTTVITVCIRALQIYQPDSPDDLEERAITEISVEMSDLRNVFHYERCTQQRRAESVVLPLLFEYA